MVDTVSLKEIEHCAPALNAPRMRESAERLAERARTDGWSHENYLAAVLSREVTGRESFGSQTRIRSATFPTRNHWRSSTSTIDRPSVEKSWFLGHLYDGPPQRELQP